MKLVLLYVDVLHEDARVNNSYGYIFLQPSQPTGIVLQPFHPVHSLQPQPTVLKTSTQLNSVAPSSVRVIVFPPLPAKEPSQVTFLIHRFAQTYRLLPLPHARDHQTRMNTGPWEQSDNDTGEAGRGVRLPRIFLEWSANLSCRSFSKFST